MKTQLHMKILIFTLFLIVPTSTFSQASLLKDIYNGTGNSNPSEVLDMGSYGIFNANNNINGTEPWITDGTTNGTILLKDIRISTLGSGAYYFTKVNDLALFVAFTNANGNELWKTDGTQSGTVLVKDIVVGENSAKPNNLINFNGDLLFTVRLDGNNPDVIWQSDGTEQGTTQVKNIRPNSSQGARVSKFVTTGFGLMFFTATDGVHGEELWASDGTEAGTYMVKDINNTIYGSGVNHITALGGNVYFQVRAASGASSLWKSDGTEAGTSVVVASLYLTDNSTSIVIFNGKLYFAGGIQGGSTGTELWVSDGTAVGTFLVKDINPGTSPSAPISFQVAGDKLFFKAITNINGAELWVTDGTEAGTNLVKDIYPGNTDSLTFSDTQNLLQAIGNDVYFSARDGSITGDTLWVSDGTEAGTYSITDTYPNSNDNIDEIFAVNNILLFTANSPTYGNEFWRLDNTLSADEYINSSKISIYPNPVKNVLTIETTFTGNLQLNVMNQLGQLVLRQNQSLSSISLDVSNISKGLYFLNIASENGNSQTIKFIKN
ncbi:ELWxxDGT repeat protein [Psychroserpens luteus]|uniref:ELWxxDGT repeat protein n=1 Tax=Psychroserpens luteus TaxID=1434066 RepID=A0ABW5ZU70_9FLAO|nr:ELWxxDGT repeat protein [Psychroserpens luteus]